MNQVVAPPPVKLPDIAIPDLYDDDPLIPTEEDEELFDWDEVLKGIQSDLDDEEPQEVGAGSGTRTRTGNTPS